MATSQRVSRGFHWLVIFLAAIPLVVGSAVSAYVATPWVLSSGGL